MTPPRLPARALRTTALACLTWLSVAPAAQAGPLVFAPFTGSGNAVLFDPVTGSGGWVGRIDQFPDPGVTDPLALVSVVLFSIDPLTQMLSGQFTFTRSSDLGATLYGLVAGSTGGADVFGQGGQIELDYTIQGGTGDFSAASGFGLSYLQLDPTASPDNYSESGLLTFAVPEPGTLPLLAGALAVLALLRRRRAA